MRFVRGRAPQLLVDSLVIAVAFAVAYAIRFEGLPPRTYVKQFVLVVPYLILLRLGLMIAIGVYRQIWRYISLRDLPRIFIASGVATAALVVARFVVPAVADALNLALNSLFSTVPYGVLAAELVLSTVGFVTVRTVWRVVCEHSRRRTAEQVRPAVERQRALLIGAGAAGVMVAREVAANPDIGFTVVGFIDDDPNKHKTVIQGYRVLGSTERMAELAEAYDAQLAILTMASVPAAEIRRIVGQAEACDLRVQIIPGLYEILSGQVNISKVRDVAIEDLLGRAPVRLEEDAIAAFLTNKVVLVTGAGGSIGSEICRQVARFRPAQLVLMDQAENPLFHIHRELHDAAHVQCPVVHVVCNVADRERLACWMRRYRPQVVFHAAAHKHVPLMEANPDAAVLNNVGGSRNVADLAHETGAAAFVMISTDKAVNPTSVMGATKRLAEMYVQALAERSETRFLTVRFGNVLASEGSVVPLFKEQIARGGPVTVTHPEMKRYFMTIPEASQLVLQAATMGEGGEIFILEMGEAIPIVNLARDLIRLSGYRPDEEIKIEFVGMRPGEKLYEEISLSEEHADKTKHPRIWVGRHDPADLDQVTGMVEQLLAAAADATAVDSLKGRIAECVPEYLQNDKAEGVVVAAPEPAQAVEPAKQGECAEKVVSAAVTS